MMLYTTDCALCGMRFMAGREHAVYCGSRCRSRARRERDAAEKAELAALRRLVGHVA